MFCQRLAAGFLTAEAMMQPHQTDSYDMSDLSSLNVINQFNIISLQYSKRAAPNQPFLEYDKYDMDNRSTFEVEFYDRCLNVESGNKTIEKMRLCPSHWVLHSQDEEHFKLKAVFYSRILIMIGQRYAYWFAETEYPDKRKKYGVVYQSYWFNAISVDLVEQILKRMEASITEI